MFKKSLLSNFAIIKIEEIKNNAIYHKIYQ